MFKMILQGFLFSLYLQGVLSLQAFTSEPGDVEVTPGHNTTLSCVVSDLGGQCRWQKDGKPMGMFPEKYSMADERSGDCSLYIQRVDLKLDDGLWECQVTSSSFEVQDSLVSRKARLTVQVPPEAISIQYSGSQIGEGGIVTLTEGKVEKVVCVTRYSNPAPSITWKLGSTVIPSQSQVNYTEEDTPNKWRSEATLSFNFEREDLGKQLTCLVRHQAYLDKREGSTHVEIDVQYKPSVRIVRVDSGELEEGVGSVSLTCLADSNPPAQVSWSRRDPLLGNQVGEVIRAESLDLAPVKREDAGTYACHAENQIGRSVEELTQVSVLYSPRIVSVVPKDRVEVRVNNRTNLVCRADANPQPKYQWLQLLPSQQVKVRSYNSELILQSVAYSDQGEYVCEAVNIIGGEKRVVRSEVVQLEVTGVPQVTKESLSKEVVAVSGRDVRLEAEFCSDPLPIRNTWEWGSTVLPAGNELNGGKYRAELVEHPKKKDCFLSRLTLQNVGQADSMPYTLLVENAHGIDVAPINLGVTDPVSMASVIGVVIALLVVFVLLSLILLVSYKKQKLCFRDPDLENMVKSKSSQYSTYNGAEVIKNTGSPGQATTKSPSVDKILLPPSTKDGDLGLPLVYPAYAAGHQHRLPPSGGVGTPPGAQPLLSNAIFGANTDLWPAYNGGHGNTSLHFSQHHHELANNSLGQGGSDHTSLAPHILFHPNPATASGAAATTAVTASSPASTAVNSGLPLVSSLNGANSTDNGSYPEADRASINYFSYNYHSQHHNGDPSIFVGHNNNGYNSSNNSSLLAAYTTAGTMPLPAKHGKKKSTGSSDRARRSTTGSSGRRKSKKESRAISNDRSGGKESSADIRRVYSQLQLPTTSNMGSMKRIKSEKRISAVGRRNSSNQMLSLHAPISLPSISAALDDSLQHQLQMSFRQELEAAAEGYDSKPRPNGGTSNEQSLDEERMDLGVEEEEEVNRARMLLERNQGLREDVLNEYPLSAASLEDFDLLDTAQLTHGGYHNMLLSTNSSISPFNNKTSVPV